MPVDRWYKFQAKRNFKTLSLEEAEEQVGQSSLLFKVYSLYF